MIFWIVSILLLATALLFVVLPLWRASNKTYAVERDGANLEIFRDQIAEMDADLSNGLLTQEMYDQGKRELQSRLLDEVGDAKAEGKVAIRNPLKMLALALSVLLPVIAITVYMQVGNQQALQQEPVAHDDGFGHMTSAAELKALEEQVAAQADNVQGLLRLARSYSQMQRFDDAAVAYDKLTKLVPDEAQLWADYADVLAMAAGKSLLGTPTAMLDKALALEPDNFKALALSGSAAMERRDYAATVRHWEKLLKMIPKDDENAKIVENSVQQARMMLAQAGGAKVAPSNKRSAEASSGKEAISGVVALSATLKAQTSPEDTLFVLVRAAEGPKMPLAIVRKQVKDLPLKFTLDDSTSMSPEMKLSNFDRVVVIARVSKAGSAMTQPGDLQGMSATIKPGTKGLKINIDQLVK